MFTNLRSVGLEVLNHVSFDLAEHSAEEDELSPAELRVLLLIAEGKSNKEIAAQLAVTKMP